MAIKTVRIMIKGKVQGVLFRNFAKQNANKLGIVGYAKNLRTGDLEIMARGEATHLDDYVRLCKRGPMFAKVVSLELEEQDSGDLDDYEFFDIRPT